MSNKPKIDYQLSLSHWHALTRFSTFYKKTKIVSDFVGYGPRGEHLLFSSQLPKVKLNFCLTLLWVHCHIKISIFGITIANFWSPSIMILTNLLTPLEDLFKIYSICRL